MKIIITSDIHEHYTQTIEKINSIDDVDYVFIAGDITNNGLYSVRYFEDFYNPVNREGEFIDFMTNIKHKTYWITGNHDTHLHSYNLESDNISNITDVKEDLKDSDKTYTITGMNMSTCHDIPHLVRYWDRMTASIEEEKDYYNMFDYSDIVLSHCPPSSTLSMVDNKENIGSKELLNYINKHNPKLLICGHVHESTGVEIIGETLCINTATEVNLLEVDLEDVKNYKITKI